MTKQIKKCVICEKEIKFKNGLILSGAIICTTHGNYGSKVFDTMELIGLDNAISAYLTFYICDSCLLARSELFQYEESLRKTQVTYSKPFNKIVEERRRKNEIY